MRWAWNVRSRLLEESSAMVSGIILAPFFHGCDKSNWGKERFVWLTVQGFRVCHGRADHGSRRSSRVYSPLWQGRSWQKEPFEGAQSITTGIRNTRVAGHITSAVGKLKEMDADAQLTFTFYSVQDTTHKMTLPILRVHLPTSASCRNSLIEMPRALTLWSF